MRYLTISTVFKDNNGALELAKCQRMRPRTKHIAIKYQSTSIVILLLTAHLF